MRLSKKQYQFMLPAPVNLFIESIGPRRKSAMIREIIADEIGRSGVCAQGRFSPAEQAFRATFDNSSHTKYQVQLFAADAKSIEEAEVANFSLLREIVIRGICWCLEENRQGKEDLSVVLARLARGGAAPRGAFLSSSQAVSLCDTACDPGLIPDGAKAMANVLAKSVRPPQAEDERAGSLRCILVCGEPRTGKTSVGKYFASLCGLPLTKVRLRTLRENGLQGMTHLIAKIISAEIKRQCICLLSIDEIADMPMVVGSLLSGIEALLEPGCTKWQGVILLEVSTPCLSRFPGTQKLADQVVWVERLAPQQVSQALASKERTEWDFLAAEGEDSFPSLCAGSLCDLIRLAKDLASSKVPLSREEACACLANAMSWQDKSQPT